MAHFLGSVKGTGGSTSRLGTKQSGIVAHAQGWNSGVSVYGSVMSMEGRIQDVFQVYITNGSAGGSSKRIGIVYIDAKNDVVFMPV